VGFDCASHPVHGLIFKKGDGQRPLSDQWPCRKHIPLAVETIELIGNPLVLSTFYRT
jgi:hypothetical protein